MYRNLDWLRAEASEGSASSPGAADVVETGVAGVGDEERDMPRLSQPAGSITRTGMPEPASPRRKRPANHTASRLAATASAALKP